MHKIRSYVSGLLTLLSLTLTSCQVSDRVSPKDVSGDTTDGTPSSLVGRWEGIFEAKPALAGGESTKAQSIVEFKADMSFKLEFKGSEPSTASGSFEDGPDALLLYVLESNILPEFSPKSYVKLTYKMRGKVLLLQSDEKNGFTLTKKNEGSDPQSPPPSPAGLTGWWSAEDADGFRWDLNVEDPNSFWLKVAPGDGNGTILKGESVKIGETGLLLTVNDCSEDRLLGRLFRLQIKTPNELNFEVLKPGANNLDPPSTTLTMVRR